jgi:Domain of unknown function (DUF4180)
MPAKSYELHGVRVLECDPNEKQLRNYNEAVELIGKAFESRASLIVVPAECLDDDFFRLSTRIAGELIQKVVQYRQRLVIVGDISRHLAESSALRAFVLEANRGKEVWFLATREELDQRLARAV